MYFVCRRNLHEAKFVGFRVSTSSKKNARLLLFCYGFQATVFVCVCSFVFMCKMYAIFFYKSVFFPFLGSFVRNHPRTTRMNVSLNASKICMTRNTVQAVMLATKWLQLNLVRIKLWHHWCNMIWFFTMNQPNRSPLETVWVGNLKQWIIRRVI